MFFIYLVLFILMVATPFIVQKGMWVFTEDEAEAIILLLAGVVSFVIYRLRDYQVFEYIRDRMKLQQSVVRAQKELSESYSYIGQANRRTDIMYEIFSDLSHIETTGSDDAILHAMESLPYTNDFCFRFIDPKKKKAHHYVSATEHFKHLPDELFCKENISRSYRNNDVLFIYSETRDKSLRTCVALPYSEKAENDIDFFKALTAYFTMVYMFHNDILHEENN